MAEIITLMCLIYGERSQDSFAVRIDREETVSELKDLIVNKNPNYFKGIDPRQLCLWKVAIENSDQDALKQLHLYDLNMLHPSATIHWTFPPNPSTSYIRVIVKVPGQNGTFRS